MLRVCSGVCGVDLDFCDGLQVNGENFSGLETIVLIDSSSSCNSDPLSTASVVVTSVADVVVAEGAMNSTTHLYFGLEVEPTSMGSLASGVQVCLRPHGSSVYVDAGAGVQLRATGMCIMSSWMLHAWMSEWC